MTETCKLRRLIDLPGVGDLELKALMKPAAQEPENRAEFPEINACALSLFGLTVEDAEAAPRPEGWDGIETAPVSAQVAAFEREGWDVTDNKRRPLRMLRHLGPPLWLAVRGVAGRLPFHPEDDALQPLASSLAREAARFKRR